MSGKRVSWTRTWGWRGRVGLIMPASQTVSEPLFYAAAPPGISFHTARLLNQAGASLESIAQLDELVPNAVAELAMSRVHCIAYLCITGGLIRGTEGEKQFVQEMEVIARVPFASALLSAFEALNAIEAHRIVIAGPYTDDHNKLERDLFTRNGFEVLGVHGLNITNGFEYGQVPPRDIYAFCKRAWDPRAEALFVACAAFNAMSVAERLEKDIGAPVVTAHSALFWKVMRLLNVKGPMAGFGRLLRDCL